jgi:ubiquinone/menaquinone biosynthesis C-methylase UbiE
MTTVLSEQAVHDRFVEGYRHAESELAREIERCVCGCDYGASSWTTVDEIQTIIELMSLSDSSHLLELGAGAGWPGLYLTAQTGCRAMLTDLPLEGLRIGYKRAVKDGLADLVSITAASGSSLPFANACFDVIFHSDVLCCLADKEMVLLECRRSVSADGCMVFPAIFPVENLSKAEQQLVPAAGPPFAEIKQPYPQLLAQTGWKLTDQIDLSEEFAISMALMNEKLQQYSDELDSLKGENFAADERVRRVNGSKACAQGLLRRELYRAVPV